jgi:hypothetical protein
MRKTLIAVVTGLILTACGQAEDVSAQPDGGYVARGPTTLMLLPGEIVHDPGPYIDRPPPPPPTTP